ncbi:MAG: hypothetical protein A2583_01605 [Bdellovibrionales bacterium RIFOXYD1_FULL_53_11]|nr:MAG: hypothetical protein A2583_01605 [Bdellovibrionales bacterium RIFOXYD1_FULL_53_11]
MSSVSSTNDSGLHEYYKKIIEQMHDEQTEERKRMNEHEENRVSKLQEDFEYGTKEMQSDMDHTVENIKEAANENIELNKTISKEDTRKLKNMLYDNLGKTNGLEAEVVKQQRDDMKRINDELVDHHHKIIDDLDTAQANRIDVLQKEHMTKQEKNTNDARTGAYNAYHKMADEETNSYKEFKNKVDNQFYKFNQDLAQQRNFDRMQTERNLADAKLDMQYKLQKSEESSDSKTKLQQNAFDDSMNNKTKRLARAHAEEVAHLSNQMKDLIQAQGNIPKARAEAISEVINNYEREWRDRMGTANDAYETTLAKSKSDLIDAEGQYARKSSDSAREKDLNYAEILKNLNNENHRRLKEIESSFDQNLQMTQKKAKEEDIQQKKFLKEQMAQAEDAKDKALEDQARAYQDTMERTRKNEEEKVTLLQKAIDKKNSGDTAEVSSTSQEKIERTIMNQFQKKADVASAVHDEKVDELLKNNAQRVQDIRDESQERQTASIKQATHENHQMKSELLQSLRDTQLSKEDSIRNMQMDQEKELQNAFRAYTSSLEKQRRQYEEILQTQRAEALTKMHNSRQELEFANRMMQRNFSFQQNEMIREYEKKVAAQKVEYDVLIEDIKSQSETSIRETERKKRQEFEEQARGYEQRIAQMEFQHKERERYNEQNFEDQMDKLKQTNAMLHKKGNRA